MNTASSRLGFIGMGTMGAPMAGHLIAAGHTLFVHTRSKVPDAIAHSVATVCATARAVAEQADIIFLMVPDTPDVEAALFSEHGVASAVQGVQRSADGHGGKVVVDMSSISPIATKAFAQNINALGCDYLDAPVSGGEVGAKNATLSIMVGGPEAAFEKVKPLFALMGKNITLVGGNGHAQTAKVANQIIVALNIEAVAEALLFAARAGADPERVRQALMGGFAASKFWNCMASAWSSALSTPVFVLNCTRKTSTWRSAAPVRWASHCPTPPPRKSCSTPALPTPAKPGTTRPWCAPWK